MLNKSIDYKSDPRHFWPNCPLLPTLRGVGRGRGEGGRKRELHRRMPNKPSTKPLDNMISS